MSRYTTTQARTHFSEIVNHVAFGKQRQILYRRGKELVAMIPIEDLRRLEALEDSQDLIEARAELKSIKTKKTKTWSVIKKEAGL